MIDKLIFCVLLPRMCETEVKGTVESQIKKRSLTSYRHSTGKLISKDLKDNTDQKFSLQKSYRVRY